MSPFLLATGELVSCMAYGAVHPLEHAGSCACPCEPCIAMQRVVLEDLGLLPAEARPLRVFLHAYGELRVSRELRADDDGDSWFIAAYRAIERGAGVRHPVPAAAFGWLLPVAGDERLLRMAKAPSDPSAGRAEAALAAWAEQRGLGLVGPLDGGLG